MNRNPRSASRGFTMIELLAVMAIIVLLIGILVPAVNGVRRSAKKTATQSSIQTMITGLETYRTDQKLGGAFPPSFSDSDGTGGAPAIGLVRNPYTGATGTGTIHVPGAGLLVFALAGADLLGTPGIRVFRTGSAPFSRFWAQDTDANGPNNPGSYFIDATTGQPRFARTGPIVDLSKVKVTPNVNGKFVVPAETDAGGVAPAQAGRDFPMFLDTYGQPFLYYRADAAGQKLADDSSFSVAGQNPVTRGLYHWVDNAQLISSSPIPHNITQRPLVMNDSGRPGHLLEYDATYANSNQLALPTRMATFQFYIHNKSITAKGTPQKSDAFLLVSAGPDGRFGTGDDIANFDPNGAN